MGLRKRFAIVAILGARKIGKTTLATQIIRTYNGVSLRFDLEDPTDIARLEDPMLALRARTGLIVLDEIQRRPNLFPVALRIAR